MDNTSFPKINYDHVLGGEFAAFVRISEVEGMASALTKLLSPSAAARAEGEAILREYSTQTLCLCFILCHPHYPPETRAMAGMVLKNAFLRNPGEDPDQYLIHRAVVETASSPVINRILISASFTLLGALATNNHWPELDEFLFKMAKREGKENVMRTVHGIRSLSNLLLRDGGNEILFEQILSVVKMQIESEFIEVQLEAVELIGEILSDASPDSLKDISLNLMPKVFEILSKCEKEENESGMKQGLRMLTAVVDNSLLLLGPHIPALIDFILKVMKNDYYEFETKKEVMDIFLEVTEEYPKKIHSYPRLLESILPMILSWLTHISEETEAEDGGCDNDETIFVNECFDRISNCLGGDRICPILLSLLPSLFISEDWRQRRAALMSISVIGEGSQEFLEGKLGELLPMIGTFCEDPHLQVRWAAINTFGQMSTDFQPVIQEKYAFEVLNPLLKCLNNFDPSSSVDDGLLRIYCHAASALINLFEVNTPIPRECFAPALEPHEKLLSSPATPNKLREYLFASLAAIYSCIPGFDFSQFKPFVMEALLSEKSTLSLKVYAWECLGHVAAQQLVLSKKELKDVIDTLCDMGKMEMSLKLYQSFCGGWLAMTCGKAVGQEICEESLPKLFNFLDKCASCEIRFSVFHGVEPGNQEEDEPMLNLRTEEESERFAGLMAGGWDSVKVGDLEIAYDAIEVAKKLEAIKGLSILAEEAPKGFLSISARVLTIFSESLDFPYDEDVKVHSAEGIPKVFHAWFASQEQEMVLLAGQMWRSLCPQLLKEISDCIEEDNSPKELVDCFTSCVSYFPVHRALSSEHLVEAVLCMKNIYSLLDAKEKFLDEDDEEGGTRKRAEEMEESLGEWGAVVFPIICVMHKEVKNIPQLFLWSLRLLKIKKANHLVDFVKRACSYSKLDIGLKFSLLSKVGIVLYEEKITKDRDYVIETLFETFLGDKTITQKEPGEDLLTFCQLCSIQEVIELGFDKVKVFVDILASFILHPPPNPSNAKEIVGKIVKNIQGEDFQKAVDFLPLVKRSAIMSMKN